MAEVINLPCWFIYPLALSLSSSKNPKCTFASPVAMYLDWDNASYCSSFKGCFGSELSSTLTQTTTTSTLILTTAVAFKEFYTHIGKGTKHQKLQ